MSALELDAPRGFVSMREYLRLQRRCEALEDELVAAKAERDDWHSPVDVERLNWLRATLKLSMQQAHLVFLLMRSSPGRRIRRDYLVERLGSQAKSPHFVAVITCHANRIAREHGGPSRLVRCERGANGNGYWIAPDDQAWVRKVVPQAFEGDKP